VAWGQKVKCGCARIGVTPITTTIGVVALHNGANPILRVAGALHDLLGGLTLSEQPENLPLAARDGIARLTVPRNYEIAAGWASTGAVIAGRTTYNLSILNWGAGGPTGAARVPTVIVSHSVPQDIPDGGVYIFVDSVEAAFEKGKTSGRK
jgi:hypothetical protein